MVLEIEMFSKKFSYLKTAVVAFVAVIDNVMMSPGVTPPKAIRNVSCRLSKLRWLGRTLFALGGIELSPDYSSLCEHHFQRGQTKGATYRCG